MSLYSDMFWVSLVDYIKMGKKSFTLITMQIQVTWLSSRLTNPDIYKDLSLFLLHFTSNLLSLIFLTLAGRFSSQPLLSLLPGKQCKLHLFKLLLTCCLPAFLSHEMKMQARRFMEPQDSSLCLSLAVFTCCLACQHGCILSRLYTDYLRSRARWLPFSERCWLVSHFYFLNLLPTYTLSLLIALSLPLSVTVCLSVWLIGPWLSGESCCVKCASVVVLNCTVAISAYVCLWANEWVFCSNNAVMKYCSTT